MTKFLLLLIVEGKLFSGFSSIDLQIDEVENNDGKESSPQLYLVFESNLR